MPISPCRPGTFAPRDRLRGFARPALIGLVAAAFALMAGLASLALYHRDPGNAVIAMSRGQYAHAARWLDIDANNGDPRAQTSLGNLHYLGLGVEQNARRAAELYHAAAGNGFAPAQINLGNLYSQGLGVANDPQRAFGWYRQADVHGSPAAEFYLYQISVEYTLSPLQQEAATKRWERLDVLAAEPL